MFQLHTFTCHLHRKLIIYCHENKTCELKAYKAQYILIIDRMLIN